MKIKRAIYYVLVLAGGGFLFLASNFALREIGLALGFVLIMAGLYGLSRSNKPPDEALNTEEDEEI